MAKQWLILGFIAALIIGCSGEKKSSKTKGESSKGSLVFKDDFDRKNLRDSWIDTGGGYSIVNGELRAQGARNRPLWLKQKLPRNARVEFTARSLSKSVDIKAELRGDGKSKAIEASYTATSYVVILGGWNNSRSIIARMNEHGKDRKSRKDIKGVPGKKYHFSIVRKGSSFSWFLDERLFLEMDDSEPLEGPGHEYFAFNNWETEVYYDNLAVYKL